MIEPLNSGQKIKKTTQDNSQPMQALTKRIPKYQRSKYEIESQEKSHRQINVKQNISQKLKFEPFCYRGKMPLYQEIGHITKILRTSSKITDTFTMKLNGGRNENNKMFLHYSEQIKKMRSLKAFDFYCWASPYITDHGLKNMSQGFKPLRSLQYLKITLVECCYINNKGIEFVAKGLRKLISLQTLDLSFDEGGVVSDEGIRVLFKNIKYLRNLQTLNISFHYCGGVSWKDIGNPAKELKDLRLLKNINLNCSLTEQMGPVGIGKISKMLEALKSLEVISLRLVECNIIDKEVKALMEGLQGKEYLKMIKLNLSRNKITDEGLATISQCFKELKVIEGIDLELSDYQRLTDEGRELLKKNLEGIASLKRLELKCKVKDKIK